MSLSRINLIVTLDVDEHGRVRSCHDFATKGDRETALALPGAGERQIAYCLLTEAVRREAYVTLLADLGAHQKSTLSVEGMAEVVRRVVTSGLGKIAEAAAREVMALFAAPEHEPVART